ncbi:unnamed protein product [Arabidopsis thaliana]|uniref:F-box domain-containing protein n=1 Tax=Arabidopsis thaliana TaxID=3702 RepID=A0A654EE93_ARATH|nr:unnamed protein product [Arabidopsis thaliana]
MKNWIPNDLIYEILSKLPAKSVARCRCVSKQWRSILRHQVFTELFLARSKARPRLLIGVQQDGEWRFYSTPQSQNPCENRMSPADFHMKFSKGISNYSCSYASGLIYFDGMCIRKEDEDAKHVLCDPLTGKYVILPELRVGDSYSYLGFDPVDKEFKLVDAECRSRFNGLINYKGKLCGIILEYASHDGGSTVKLSMWVLEDVEKPEWSKHVYSLWTESQVVKVNHNLSVSGMTATGDIVLSTKYASQPFYVFYFNQERKTLQVPSVEVEGLGANRACMSYYAFADYVEDLSVNDAVRQLKSSPLQQQGQNIVTKRPKPRQGQDTSHDLSKSAPSVKNNYIIRLGWVR